MLLFKNCLLDLVNYGVVKILDKELSYTRLKIKMLVIPRKWCHEHR